LTRCLEPLRDSGALEVIVTDDSTDHATRDLIADRFPWAYWTQASRRGPAANRNHGAKMASGEWLAFIDDDCIPQHRWLEAIIAETSIADVIEGKTVCPLKRDTPLEEHVENLTGGNLWSCNMAIRRQLFEELGGFDEDFLIAGGEDMEFARRVQRNQSRVRFAPSALMHHPSRYIGWSGLWKRTFQAHWGLLYHLKFERDFPLVRYFILDLLRTTYHLYSRHIPSRWKSRWFLQGWKWLTAPLVLPYLMQWKIRFLKKMG